MDNRLKEAIRLLPDINDEMQALVSAGYRIEEATKIINTNRGWRVAVAAHIAGLRQKVFKRLLDIALNGEHRVSRQACVDILTMLQDPSTDVDAANNSRKTWERK